MLTMYGAHHPKADVDRIYLKRVEGGRGLIGVEDCVRIEIDSLEKYLRTSREELLIAVNRKDAFIFQMWKRQGRSVKGTRNCI